MELIAADESGHILLAVVNDLPLTANTFVPTVVPPTKPQCQISTALSRHKIKLDAVNVNSSIPITFIAFF